jgi:DNA polymerase-3 subunit epsilon
MAAHLTLYPERALMERFGLTEVNRDRLGRIQRTAKTQLESSIAR